MPESLYRYIWSINRRGQILLILVTAAVFPLSMVPLEIQRRIIDDAIKEGDFNLLMLLGGAYLAFLAVQGGLKFLMNMQRGHIVQQAVAHLRGAVYFCIYSVMPPESFRKEDKANVDQGTVVSMLSAEVEKIGQFIGGWFVIQGKTELGTIVAFLSGFEKITGPWSELIGFYRQSSNAQMKYAMLVDAFPERPENTGAPPDPQLA